MSIVLQVGDAADGSVVITASPAVSTATHSDAVGHETALKFGEEGLASISRAVQVGLAALGSVEISATPAAGFPDCNATHREVDSHEIAPSALPGSMSVLVQVGVADVGSVETNTLPVSSTAAQNDAEPHETAAKTVLSTDVVVHVGVPAVGSVETRTRP